MGNESQLFHDTGSQHGTCVTLKLITFWRHPYRQQHHQATRYHRQEKVATCDATTTAT